MKLCGSDTHLKWPEVESDESFVIERQRAIGKGNGGTASI
jgi:hypothetical protein